MNTSLKVGQTVKGKVGVYTLIQQLHESVWLAMNQRKRNVIFKSVNHFRIQNERDILLRFQSRSTYIRPLLDETEDSVKPLGIVLKYLDDDLLHASDTKRLTRAEIKYVAKRVLEALRTLHSEGLVHTDIKPSNVLVNYGMNESRFADVQLGDFGSTVHADSKHAIDGEPIGTPIFRSPEAHIQLRWGTATDIWSFGVMLISLIYGEGFHIFKSDVPADHEDYAIKILMKHHRCFGPFPASYEQIADDQRLAVLTWVMQNSPAETLRPFHLTTGREICADDKQFVLKAMRLDPRDRLTAQELLDDKWFEFD